MLIAAAAVLLLLAEVPSAVRAGRAAAWDRHVASALEVANGRPRHAA